MTGEVVQVSGKKATVAVGEILTRVDISKLALLSANQYRASVKSPVSVKSSVRLSSSISERKLNFKPSIDVRGMHLEEAIPAVTDFDGRSFRGLHTAWQGSWSVEGGDP